MFRLVQFLLAFIRGEPPRVPMLLKKQQMPICGVIYLFNENNLHLTSAT